VARAHGLTARQLGWFNPKVARLKSGNLRAGQRIVVPRADVAKMALDVPNPSIEKYPKRRVASKVHRASGKATARKPAAKKPAAKKSTAKKPSVKASTVKKAGVKKSVVTKPTVKKPAVKKPAAKKPAAKKN
ncbi:MAG: hypothetical protein ACYC3L_13575, partial [Gemmatimonadaceae bacterium]